MNKKASENNKNKNTKSFGRSMINSVEKFNGTTLFFIVVLSAIVVFITCILLFSNRKYIYIPDYEVMSYSEDINPGVIVISSYNEVENSETNVEEIVKTNRIILSLAYVNKAEKRNFTISELKGNYIGVVDEENYEYLTEYTNEDDMPSASARTHQFASTESGSKFDYKTILGELSYKFKEELDNDEVKEEKRTIEYKVDMIELTDEDMSKFKLDDSTAVNDFSDNPDYFSSYSVYQEVSESTDSKTKTKKMYSSITIKVANLEKYVFDYQLFGIDANGNVDPMVGYYNLSTNVKTTYSRSTNVPFDKEYKYLVAKGILRYEENGEAKELTLYSKKEIK